MFKDMYHKRFAFYLHPGGGGSSVDDTKKTGDDALTYHSELDKLLFGDFNVADYTLNGEGENDLLYGNRYYMKETSLWLTSVYSIGWEVYSSIEDKS